MKARPSRRALFGSAALLATLPAFARPHGPDHELIALCGAFIAACDRYDAAWTPDRSDAEASAEGNAVMDLQRRQLARMGELRAVTAEGIQARALALHHHTRGRNLTFHPAALPGRLLAACNRELEGSTDWNVWHGNDPAGVLRCQPRPHRCGRT